VSIDTYPARVYELRTWNPSSARGRVVTCAGELDLHAAPELRFLLCQMMQLGVRDLVVDLTATTFIDSTVIGVLTGRLRRLRADGGSLVLVCTNDFVLRTIEIAGMDRVFEIYPTLAQGLAREASR
jgi:anti-sigma B factor antagonist